MYELRMKAGSVAVFENPKSVVVQTCPYLDAKEKKMQPAKDEERKKASM
jgi:hypothetical protein